MKTALILYPHQLFAAEHLPAVDTIYVVEEPLFFGVDPQYPVPFHKQKIMLHRASMRRYVEEVLWPAGFEVEYIDLSDDWQTADIITRARKHHVENLFVFELTDYELQRRLQAAISEEGESLTLTTLDSPSFYLKDSEIRAYYDEHKKVSFAHFYQWQRERFGVLIDENYHPVGGKWSYEHDASSVSTNDVSMPGLRVFGDNDFVIKAREFVTSSFVDSPGSADDFSWPTNHEEAIVWLDDFIEHRLKDFGAYEHAIDSRHVWLFHSAISTALNIGLVTPHEVIMRVLEHKSAPSMPLESLEGFVREILGWREYMRAVYVTKGVSIRNANIWQQSRRMTPAWYTGQTGLQPFDDMVKKLQTHAYAHNAERLRIAGNLMMISEIHPNDMYQWFSSLFIDAYDWITLPHVFALSQFVDEPSMTAHLSICTSAELLAVSNYEKSAWCDVWDGLYWRFVEKHREKFADELHMKQVVAQLDKLDESQKRIIGYRAEDFLASHTAQ